MRQNVLSPTSRSADHIIYLIYYYIFFIIFLLFFLFKPPEKLNLGYYGSKYTTQKLDEAVRN